MFQMCTQQYDPAFVSPLLSGEPVDIQSDGVLHASFAGDLRGLVCDKKARMEICYNTILKALIECPWDDWKNDAIAALDELSAECGIDTAELRTATVFSDFAHSVSRLSK